MILARRILPFLGTAIVLLSYSWLLWRPASWVTALLVILVWVFFSTLFLAHWKWRSASFWASLFPIAAFLAGGSGMLFFVGSSLGRWIFIVVLAGVYAVYTETIFVYYYQPQLYTNLSLPRLSYYALTLGGFFSFSFLWALQLIGVFPVWMITVLAFLYTAAVMLHILRGYQLWEDQHLSLVILVSLLVAETVWVLQFWPTAFYINGLMTALVIYFVPSMAMMYLRDTLTKQVLFRYTVVSILVIVAVLATSQWT